MNILRAVLRNADASWDEIGRFAEGTAEADYLFGDDVSTYLREIYRQCVKLRTANEQYRDYTQEKPPDYDHTKIVEERHAAVNWLTEQIAVAKTKFGSYLRIGR